MFSFLYFYFAWTIVLLKRLLSYLYIWQKKEYRIDKVVDYLNTPESKGFLWDRFTRVYFGCFSLFVALYFLFTYQLIDKTLVLVLAIAAIILVNIVYWVDTIISTVKLVKGTLLKPIFTSKMIGIFVVSLVILYGLVSFVTVQIFPLNIFYGLLVLFAIPFVVLISSLFIKPIEIYQKKQIINQAKSKRAQLKNLKVIAISGSYGKTTTKDVLYELLNTKFKTVKSQKNQNTTLSLARQIISLDAKTEIFIAEVGAYKKGDGNDACSFLSPNTSIITGLNNQHLSLFGSEQNIIEAESESLSFLPIGSKAYINNDSPMCHIIKIPENIQKISYGLNSDSDIYGTSIITKNLQSSFTLHHDNINSKLTTNLLSSGNIENLVGAIGVALDLGVEISSIKEIITNLEATPGALEVIPKPWGNLLNDSYNANINGVVNAISLLNQFKGKKVVVLDDILELGEQAIDTHKTLAYSMAKLDLDLIVLMGRNYASVIKEILESEGFKGKYYIYDKETKIVDNLIVNSLNNPTNLLLEGYRSRVFLDKCRVYVTHLETVNTKY
jgi:UDP-N-acetylmuramoyl-tripeptide--D-alanyl-D-alanine ligase